MCVREGGKGVKRARGGDAAAAAGKDKNAPCAGNGHHGRVGHPLLHLHLLPPPLAVAGQRYDKDQEENASHHAARRGAH